MSKIDVQQVKELTAYIARNWERTWPGDKPRAPLPQTVPCPYTYTTPNVDGGLQYFFYWDTYFTNLGLLRQGRLDLARNNVDAMVWHLHQCGWVPNINFPDGMNRSQLPFLSMMVRECFEKTGDREWLARMEHALKLEYLFWMTRRITPLGLNRFFHDATEQDLLPFFDDCLVPRVGLKADNREDKLRQAAHYMAEAESCADFTSRFEGECADCAAVDLNCNLYTYERNFAWMACQFGREAEGAYWARRASERAKLIQKFFWNEEQGGFYDYNFIKKRNTTVLSPVSFQVLAAGLATYAQAEKMRAKLQDIECEHGIAATDKVLIDRNLQWDRPRGWPPHFYMVVQGLKRYGFAKDARRIQEKYVQMNLRHFEKDGCLWEKFDVSTGERGVAEYGIEQQLGWTAGIFITFAQDLGLSA